MKIRARSCVAAALLLALAPRAQAYIDLAPTLGKLVHDSKSIALVEVTAYDPSTHTLSLKLVRALKGTPPDQVQHLLSPDGEVVPTPILRWASAGNRAVVFTSANRSVVCVGTAWYAMKESASVWKPGEERPDLPLAYYGGVSRLSAAVAEMLTGQPTVITTVAYGVGNQGAMFDIALNRQNLPGLMRVQRIRGSLDMPGSMLAASSDPGFYVGPGFVDKEDLPVLLEQLAGRDPAERAEAAEDVGSLGKAGASAEQALTGLLQDGTPRVRAAAAGALLRIKPGYSAALQLITRDLASKDAPTRRAAAAAAGFAGSSGKPYAPRLAELLKDPDPSVRLEALQSLSMLGPAAVEALPSLMALLDDKDLSLDAADAIGRIGPDAKSALPRLTQMLASDQKPVQWAAVRAMSQIGGPDAHPAVDYIIKAMPKANEVEGYNLMIYLALLGPVAKDAVPKLPSFGLKNKMLTQATLWAINSDKGYPWKPVGNTAPGFGLFGMGVVPQDTPGFGQGGGMGQNLFGSLISIMYVSYVHNLGPRLAPVAPRLATDIMKDTAGDVPTWGYEILAADPAKSLAILQPYLSNKDADLRERAAVAIGYMGAPAAAAKDALAAAAKAAPTEPEKRLMMWAMNKVASEQEDGTKILPVPN